MAMTQAQFDTLVRKLDKFSRQHPRNYRLQVTLLALLGYAYIFLVLAVLLALVGLIVASITVSHRIHIYTIKLIFLLLIPMGLIIRSLWVTFPHPQDLKLKRSQVPYLFKLVDELTAELKAPRFHNILLNREFNAAVVQVPRLGLFGWHENYLLLGLPLMQSLSLEQFKAVLAHEFGHLSGNHSRFNGWIYRLRKTWLQIYERLNENNRNEVSILLNPFFSWYWPTFNAYSFSLGRLNEYEADRCAAKFAGKHHIAESLICSELKSRFLESSFWSDLYQQVNHQIDPPENAYSSMLEALHLPIDRDKSDEWLETALAQKTNNIDTHPCLTDRLKALGYLKASPLQTPKSVTVKKSAAERLLGKNLHAFAALFDREWKEEVFVQWRHRYAYQQEAQSKLDDLERQAKRQPLDDEEAWERAYYTLKLQGDEAAIPLLEEVVTRQPERAEASYALGQILLRKDDEAGVSYIETAIAQRMDWAIDGYELVYRFFSKRGQSEEAQHYRQRAETQYQLRFEANQERSGVSDRDRFKPHSLNGSEVNALKKQLAAHPEVLEVYVVQKVVAHFPEQRFYAIGVIHKQGLIEREDEALKLCSLIANNLEFSYGSCILSLSQSRNRNLKRKICQVSGSLIYKR
jgi:Zn-dependent protease with chaperone function